MKRRFFVFLMVSLMSLALIATYASAQSGTTGGRWQYPDEQSKAYGRSRDSDSRTDSGMNNQSDRFSRDYSDRDYRTGDNRYGRGSKDYDTRSYQGSDDRYDDNRYRPYSEDRGYYERYGRDDSRSRSYSDDYNRGYDEGYRRGGSEGNRSGRGFYDSPSTTGGRWHGPWSGNVPGY